MKMYGNKLLQIVYNRFNLRGVCNLCSIILEIEKYLPGREMIVFFIIWEPSLQMTDNDFVWIAFLVNVGQSDVQHGQR